MTPVALSTFGTLIKSMFNFSFLPEYLPYFVRGVAYTLLLAIGGVLIAIIPALALALMRLSKNKIINFIAGAYIAAFRSTPLYVQLSIIYLGVFSIIRIPTFYVFGFVNVAMFVPGIITLALNSAAYVAEIIRGGILAVDQGQGEAARSLGMTQGQSMRYVVLPQAIKNILPSLANELITMIKESSLCGAIGMYELMWAAKTTGNSTYLTMSPYLLAAAVYFCINYPAGKVIELLERRMRRGDRR